MRARLHVSTDVAAFGIWDVGFSGRHDAPVLEALAAQGEAYVLKMGSDSAGIAAVFVDEDIPADLLAETTPILGDRTVVTRSGTLVIDGIEFFVTRDESSSRVHVAEGTYLVAARILKNEDELPEPASEAEIRRRLGADAVAYYDRANRVALLRGLSTLLLLPLLLYFWPWFVAVPVTLAVFAASFHLHERLRRRDPRYQALDQQIVALRLGNARPLIVLHLTSWNGALCGGQPLSIS